MTLATIYNTRHKPVPNVPVVDLGGGVGRIACLECEGTGRWGYAAPEIPEHDCVDCKGTGRRFIMYWPMKR